jgi:hypothetical protein
VLRRGGSAGHLRDRATSRRRCLAPLAPHRTPRALWCGTDSGLRSATDDYQFVFVGAGAYKVSDSGSAKTGSIKVPVIVKPKSGGTGTTFTVTWAASVPVGYDFDVQIKRPGGKFVGWRPDTVATSATFVPNAGAGTYRFRARIEKGATGPASGYSAAAKITVS